MLATAHVCLGGVTEDELVEAIMNSPHNRLLGGQISTTIGDRAAQQQNTGKNIFSSKNRPPFKWIVHLRGLKSCDWSEPVHVKPALERYFENKNRLPGSQYGGGTTAAVCNRVVRVVLQQTTTSPNSSRVTCTVYIKRNFHFFVP